MIKLFDTCMNLNAWLANKNKSKTAIYVFGRMNPPTKGHELLIQKVRNIAATHGITVRVFVSRTQNGNKNPLAPATKVKLLQKMFPGVSISNQVNPFTAGQTIKNENFNHVILVGGSNRTREYSRIAGGKSKAGTPYPMNFFQPIGGERVNVKTFKEFMKVPNNNKNKAYSGTLVRSVLRNNSINEKEKVIRLKHLLSNKLNNANIRGMIPKGTKRPRSTTRST